MSSIVSVININGGDAKVSARDVIGKVREAMELAEWRSSIDEGSEVSLKVNLGWDMFLPGAVSAPWVVEGIIETIKNRVGKIYIVESSQVLVDVERALKQTGLDKVCDKYNVEWINMSKGSFKKVKMEENAVIGEVDLPEILLRTDVITVPLMKTHGRTTITGAIKNQWGCLRELRHNYHPVLNEALADVNSLVKVKFAVMDGTVGLEGNGPKSGIPKIADRILASCDPVALDNVAARVMGFDPSEIKHLQYCEERGLGTNKTSEIEIKGEDISGVDLQFSSGKNNQVAVVEMVLRHGVVQKLVFDTWLFKLACWGAIQWYKIWFVFKGRKYRDDIIKGSRYGPQWS